MDLRIQIPSPFLSDLRLCRTPVWASRPLSGKVKITSAERVYLMIYPRYTHLFCVLNICSARVWALSWCLQQKTVSRPRRFSQTHLTGCSSPSYPSPCAQDSSLERTQSVQLVIGRVFDPHPRHPCGASFE